MNILSLPAPLALVQVWTDNNFLPLFKQEEEDSLVVMSGTRVKFVGLGGRGGKAEKDTRNEGSCEERQLRDFHGDFPPSETASDPWKSLSLSLAQAPRDPRRSPGSPEPDSTCQETGREQDSISPSHIWTSDG